MVSMDDLAVRPMMGSNREEASSTLSAYAALIEDTRSRLYVLAAAKRYDLQDPDVLSLSHKLDTLIVAFERLKKSGTNN